MDISDPVQYRSVYFGWNHSSGSNIKATRSQICDRIKIAFAEKRVSQTVIHTVSRERVFMIYSITEVVEVVYCGQCGKWCFSAELCGFGCGTIRGKAGVVIQPYPHTP